MGKYIYNDIQAVKQAVENGNVTISIQKTIASIKFDAVFPGTYVVDVKQDGSYSINYNDKTNN